MLKCLLVPFLLLVFSVQTASADDVGSVVGEAAEQWVERVTGAKAIPRQWARTKSLGGHSNVLVAFTQRTPPGESDHEIVMNVLWKGVSGDVAWTSRTVCEIEGGSPTLTAFFFANADDTADQEIGVICRWPDHPYADGCEIGTEVRFYKAPAMLASGMITQLNESNFSGLYVEKSIAASPEFEREGMVCRVPRFSNARDIKRLLPKVRSDARSRGSR